MQAGEINPDGVDVGHGTMVSGVLGATGNNGVGIAGVDWSTTILPLQAIDDNGNGNTLTVAEAVIYAADHKADIISLSLGGSQPDPYLRQAIDYAIDSGSVVVAAAGNDGCDCVSYPANYPEVIAVGSSDSSNNRSTFSNYGNNLDILAPGENIIAPSWSKSLQTNGYVLNVSGTSFSTPLVSGLLALVKSNQPTASWGEITAALTEQSNRLSFTATNPRSSSYGYGIAKADTLLSRATTQLNPTTRYQLGPIVPADSLDSNKFYQCENGRLPSTPLYELKSGSKIKFTISELTKFRAESNNWTSNVLFYGCTGLPNDNPTLTRTINLLNETYNLSSTQIKTSGNAP